MSTEIAKIGIISCSGEAIPEGTISRLATRRVLRTAAAQRDGHALPAAFPRREWSGTEFRQD
jgi:hypothetical protein